MGFGDALHEAQAESVALNLPIEREPAAVERLENVRQILRVDAAAAIADRDLHFVGVSSRRRCGSGATTTSRASARRRRA